MGITGERLLRALELFQEWCDLSAPDREARLAELAAADAGLAQQVRDLLEEDRQAEGAWDSDTLSLDKERLGRWIAESTAPQVGHETAARRAMPARIGDYRVLAILGVGGMGVVYRAEQDSPRRPVAVKVVHPTSLSKERRKRLRQEAEILGRLEHPGIARIYSAGTDDFGAGPQPYFAMEFVEGRPLARYCDKVKANTSERVELLVQVCEAVDYAHRLGIVHRDLKPDNVLVQADGQPRVLDFGVARSLEPGTDATSMRTEDGRLVGTLSYMSPEQVEGVSEGLTPACDVYSLGAMLFEILTGRTPHDLEGQGLLGALQLLQSKNPERLGSARRDLRGDLDCIVGKALHRDPEWRYATAGDLADDLRRYLRKEPIVAREPSTLYELRRFVARNPVLVAGVASTLLGLLVGVIVSTGLTLRAQAGERLARQQSYIASIRAVDADLRLGDSMLALEDLAALPRESRDWEWHHLVARVNDSLSLLVEDVDPGAGLALLDPQGPRVAFVRNGELWRFEGTRHEPVPWVSVGSPVNVISRPNAAGEIACACEDGGLWIVAESVSEPRLLGRLPEPAIQLDWSERRGEVLAMGDGSILGIAPDGTQRMVVEARDSRHMLRFAYADTQDLVLVSFSQRDLASKSSRIARAFDVRTGERLWQVHGRAPAIDPQERWGFLGTTWGGGRLVDLNSGDGRLLPGQSVGSVRTSSFSPGGGRLFTSNGGRSLEIRALPGGGIAKRADVSPLLGSLDRPLLEESPELGERVPEGLGASAVWIDEGSLLMAHSGAIYQWDAEVAAAESFAARNFGYDLRFSPDGRWLLFHEFQRDWVLVDVLMRREVARLPQWTRYACFAADGTSILIRARHWCRLDLGSLELLEELEAEDSEHTGTPLAVHALLDLLDPQRPTRVEMTQWVDGATGRSILQGEQLWARALRPGAPEFEVEQQGWRPHRGLAWHRDRGWLAGANDRVRIYDDEHGELLAELGSRSSSTYAVAFHPDGKRLATGGADGEIILWETDRWTPVLSLRGHELYVRALEFSPDGHILASASGDRSVRLWDSRTREGRSREAGVVRAARSEVREAVESLIAAGTRDLAAAVHRQFPAGVRRAAALSWMHELSNGGALPFVSTSAIERYREAQRRRTSESEPDAEAHPPGPED